MTDLAGRIRRQLALGCHPATGAPLAPRERAFYLALLAGLPAARAQVAAWAAAYPTPTVTHSIAE
jgi:hypothetical protein